jgi:hypothetical protein
LTAALLCSTTDCLWPWIISLAWVFSLKLPIRFWTHQVSSVHGQISQINLRMHTKHIDCCSVEPRVTTLSSHLASLVCSRYILDAQSISKNID